MSNIENLAKSIMIEMHATLTASLLAKSTRIPSLIILMGPSKAGKSTLIDFLAARSLIHIQDEELDVMKVVEQTNQNSEYPLVHVMEAVSGGEPAVLLESITLGQDMEDYAQSNLVKILMLKQAVRVFQKVSLVLVVEEMRKEDLGILAGQVLEWTGGQHEGMEEILAHCYLCLTKTEDCEMEDVLENLKALAEDYEDPKVKALIELLATPDRVVEFKNAQPSAHEARQILEKLMPAEITPAFRECIESERASSSIILGELDQRELFETASKAVKIISTLIAYLMDSQTDKKALQKNYEQSVKQLFSGKQKMDLRKMVKKIAPGLLATANPTKALSRNCQEMLAIVCFEASNLLRNLKDQSDIKEEMEELIGILTFCGSFSSWVKEVGLEKDSKILHELFMSCFKFVEEPKRSAEKKGEKAKKVKQTPFSLFKAALQTCKTNEQAIKVCIGAIKQKEREVNFDWRDGIYYLRLLRDLLKIYQHTSKKQSFFIEELLELYLYTEDYYDYEKTIAEYLRYGSVCFSTLTVLIRKLDALKRYESCLRCINSGISNTLNDDVFQILLKLKAQMLAKMHEQYINRGKETADSNERVREGLNLSHQSILRKLSDDDSGFLLGNHFQKLFGVQV